MMLNRVYDMLSEMSLNIKTKMEELRPQTSYFPKLQRVEGSSEMHKEDALSYLCPTCNKDYEDCEEQVDHWRCNACGRPLEINTEGGYWYCINDCHQ